MRNTIDAKNLNALILIMGKILGRDLSLMEASELLSLISGFMENLDMENNNDDGLGEK